MWPISGRRGMTRRCMRLASWNRSSRSCAFRAATSAASFVCERPLQAIADFQLIQDALGHTNLSARDSYLAGGIRPRM
jgi:hypothetical protein